MNVELLKSAGVDYDRGVKRFMGRAHLYEKTLSKFARDSSFSRIQAAFGAGDMEQLFASAHEFKGMCGNVALSSLYDMASELVELLRSGAYTQAEIADAFRNLEGEYNAVHAAVLAAMEESL